MKTTRQLALILALASPVGVLHAAAREAATEAPKPAAAAQVVLPSHGVTLYGIFYLAAGAGLHPTAVLFHGFPGFEQNLDIAQDLRAHGWNVLAMHYRGSWGVKGDFSFEHSAEDADTEVNSVLDPENARTYGIDTHRVIVIGHSMGGFMAASAAAHNKSVAEAVLISAWNIGADYETHTLWASATTPIESVAKGLAKDNNLLPLSGTSAEALAREIYDHRSALNLDNLASAIANRPVFVITASDHEESQDQALAAALRRAGDTHVTERHWDTDHSYSGVRTDLSAAILKWTEMNLPSSVSSSEPIRHSGPSAGTEGSLRRYIISLQQGHPNYDEMSPQLAAAVNQQLPKLEALISGLGALKSLTYEGTDPDGSDVYLAAFARGQLRWHIGPLVDGKVTYRRVRRVT